MKRSEHDLSRWGVCHTSLIHFNKVYFGTIISHCALLKNLLFIKELVDLISLFYHRLWFFFYELARMRKNSFFVYSQFTSSVLTSFFFLLGAHVVLLARTWADWTDEKFTWMEKIRSCAYMMRLLLWPNGVWRRILPINATPTSWQFARVPGKRSAPTSCRAELPTAGLAWASLAS